MVGLRETIMAVLYLELLSSTRISCNRTMTPLESLLAFSPGKSNSTQTISPSGFRRTESLIGAAEGLNDFVTLFSFDNDSSTLASTNTQGRKSELNIAT